MPEAEKLNIQSMSVGGLTALAAELLDATVTRADAGNGTTRVSAGSSSADTNRLLAADAVLRLAEIRRAAKDSPVTPV